MENSNYIAHKEISEWAEQGYKLIKKYDLEEEALIKMIKVAWSLQNFLNIFWNDSYYS